MGTFLDEFQFLKIQLEDIKLATDNFSDINCIGIGGFGRVYKGMISHSKGRSMVAFKRLDRRYGQGEPEFWKEIMMLSHYAHENIVSLLGYCDEGNEKILVYEHATHGSLDRHLGSNALTWLQRLKICFSAAKALRYLHDHRGKQQRVLHRDIKSSNILLDENWNPKVSDLGLSKIGPANQQHTVLVSNAVGTPGYCDPMYFEMGFLTKESDIYSFGVVLFEVLCGRLCTENNNGQFQILVHMWKQSYEQKKLDEIIFQNLRQQMDLNSLETFSDIAYGCLQKSRQERPTIAHIVEELELAIDFQEIYEGVKLPTNYGDIINTAVPPLVYRSEVELKRLFYKGILVNGGKTWFSLNKNGEHCEMVSAAECFIQDKPWCYQHFPVENSRFAASSYLVLDGKFKTRVRAHFLSPGIIYTVNLVFKYFHQREDTSKPTYSCLKYRLEGETKSSTSYLADAREDGWLMAELYQFTNDGSNVDLKIMFEGSAHHYSTILLVDGIEFLPLEKAKDEGLKDEKVDMRHLQDSDTYWEQKLPIGYEEIIKLSKDSLQWTTKKELYYVLCKGFLINNGNEWFSLAQNGKKCHMLPARAALVKNQWIWRSRPESRFTEVAAYPNTKFSIVCEINSQLLSPQTAYACYLVYKLPKNHSEYEAPLKVKDKISDLKDSEDTDFRFIYLLSPKTPVIRRKLDENIHKPLSRPKMKDIPKLRKDDWMEVEVWKFQTTTTEMIPMRVDLATSSRKCLEGITVQGIEFRPR